jgi:4-amino-4-deoxy-L-arabinose transferase-like glycosyltransferase
MIALILASAGLRLWRLPELPPGLWYDEAYNGMDALRMLETHVFQVFFLGNHGREPMIHYLSALSVAVLGATPYALRLVSALQSLIAVALMYRWLVTMFGDDPDRHWLALTGSAGLAVSFWYLVMTRNSYRANLVPLFVILTGYWFWRGWRTRSAVAFGAAGAALGLSQYTYLSARLLPLTFGLFGLAWSGLAWRNPALVPERRSLWVGLVTMAVSSAAVFLPLGWFYVDHPAAFSYRTGSVFVLNSSQDGLALLRQVLDALRTFVDGSDSNWRHSLPGRAAFDWLTTIGFWAGMVVVLTRIKRPVYLFLLISLLVLWLPACLATPPVNALRLSGLLPVYYAIVALGFLAPVRWLTQRSAWRSYALTARAAAVALLCVVSGSLTAYDYFERWATHPMVYRSYNGALADLTGYLVTQSQRADVILPFDIYAHPTTRFLLHDTFQEAPHPSPLTPGRPVILVSMPDSTSSTYVWLTRTGPGPGSATMFELQSPDALAALVAAGRTVPFDNPYLSAHAAALTDLDQHLPLPINRYPDSHWPPARLTQIENAQALAALVGLAPPLAPVDYDWGHQVRLTGYRVAPAWVKPGQSLVLDLNWQGLEDQPPDYETFVQVVDERADPIGQVYGNSVSVSTKQRWRSGAAAPEQRTLWIGPNAEPGAYLVRLGLANPDTGARLPVYGADGSALGDQLCLGLFYVAAGESDPRPPQTTLQARWGDQITLLGYSLAAPPQQGSAPLRIRLHWQAGSQIDADYTAFVQLLDAGNHLIASQDSQPLAGQYPTSRWQPGEIVVSEFNLTPPGQLAPGDYRLVTGLYDLATGRRLPVSNAAGRPLPDAMVVLLETRLP